MIKEKFEIEVLILAVLLVSMVFVPAVGAKTVDSKTEEVGPFSGIEMPEELKKNVVQVDPYTFVFKGEINDNFINWIEDNDYKLIELGDILGISGSKRKEVLVTNYDVL